MELNTLIIAQIQMQVARDKGANIAHAERLIREAAQREAARQAETPPVPAPAS